MTVQKSRFAECDIESERFGPGDIDGAGQKSVHTARETLAERGSALSGHQLCCQTL